MISLNKRLNKKINSVYVFVDYAVLLSWILFEDDKNKALPL